MKFFVGVGGYRLDMRHCNSLKDKRQLVRRITDRLARGTGMAAAEVGEIDYWKSCTMAVTCVSSSYNLLQSSLDEARKKIESLGVDVIEQQRSVFNPEDWIGSETCQGE